MEYPKMNPKIKKMWVKALRSGEYVQGRERLLTIEENGEHSFCCLGVLSDLHSRETGEEWSRRYSNFEKCSLGAYKECETLPDRTVESWSNLDFGAQDKLANMNDKGKSFKAIANWISKYL